MCSAGKASFWIWSVAVEPLAVLAEKRLRCEYRLDCSLAHRLDFSARGSGPLGMFIGCAELFLLGLETDC